MQIYYFAWLRTTIGIGGEKIDTQCNTVAELVEYLRTLGYNYNQAFTDIDAVRIAVNQEFGDLTTPLKSTDEVAFFPPITGG